MPETQKLKPSTTALLSLDVQKGVFDFLKGGAEAILKPSAKALAAARAKQLHVMHIGIGFRSGYPEVHPEHPTFGMIRQSGRFIVGTESAAFHDAMEVRPNEITVVKHRVSAFSGNDLEMILRSQGITHLVLFGIATSGIVLSTLRQAADLDFRCVVLKDCCADGDEEVHRVLTEKVFARQATVVSADTFASELIA